MTGRTPLGLIRVMNLVLFIQFTVNQSNTNVVHFSISTCAFVGHVTSSHVYMKPYKRDNCHGNRVCLVTYFLHVFLNIEIARRLVWYMASCCPAEYNLISRSYNMIKCWYVLKKSHCKYGCHHVRYVQRTKSRGHLQYNYV